MDRPLLVSGRKFDIRCFVLVTHSQRKGLSAYFFNGTYLHLFIQGIHVYLIYILLYIYSLCKQQLTNILQTIIPSGRCLCTDEFQEVFSQQVGGSVSLTSHFLILLTPIFFLDNNRETHLTNDAVQKHSKAYGKFEV